MNMSLDGKETRSLEKVIHFLRNVHDKKAVKDTIDELCLKGVAKGCYQDYGLLNALLDILTAIEGDIQ